MPAPLPRTVGRYQILDRVAVGGMAELYKAQLVGQAGFEKLVAIKKILPHLAADRGFIEMFVDEARLTAQLDHRHIVQVFELGTDADTPYIAMQFVDGLDVLGLLRECVRAQLRLPPEAAAMIARDVLDALDYAHHARDLAGRPLGIVHRDVSPGNVLLSWRGDVKLTDFGIARAIERHHKTEAGTLKGKYGYMSPEQVSGVEVDARSDVFSAGILLAEMVMARRLFTAESDLEVLLMVRDARLDRLARHAADFPPALRAIATRALARRPADRYPSAAALRDDLDAWLRGQPRFEARELAALIGEVLRAPSAEGDGVVAAAHDPDAMMSGPSTRRGQALAEAEARAARARFASVPEPILEVGDETSSGVVVVEDAAIEVAVDLDAPSGAGPDRPEEGPAADLVAWPGEAGDLRDQPVLRLLCRLARTGGTGLLVLDGRAGVRKEAYLLDGQPQHVHSNVERERLGSFLVAQGAITPQALARALSVMHHFGGRLAETLVGLELLRPLDAYGLLTRQVAAKLVEACGWAKGRYRWAPGYPNPWTTRPLHLDAFRIAGLGAAALGEALVEDWLAVHGPAFIVAEPASAEELAAFNLREPLARVHALLDGRSRLAELAGRVRSTDARLNLLRLAYLLVQADLARLT